MHAEALQTVALAVAQERSLEVVLKRIVEGLAEQTGIALARVWLLGPGDICERCRLRADCLDQTQCLHLMASAGRSLSSDEDWSRLNGDFCRFPLGKAKIGWIGATGESVLLKRVPDDPKWFARPEWTRRERIQSFAGHALSFRGDRLGVLGVFSRANFDDTAFGWLRIFADQAAVAIANSRAFEEIHRLRERLELENAYLREEVNAASGRRAILGNSPGLRRVLDQIDMVAPADIAVLVQGESGVGKELVAHAIHERSMRRDRPLVKVNCAAVPRELFESEFFGHVKGAFSGASANRVGRFQLADGGALLLDEVSELPMEMQPKLLRVLQDGEFEPVGEDRTRRVNVRIIAATNRDLKGEVRAGRFRHDLYYRLSVFPIEVPPLRERLEDIAGLATYFLKAACERFNRPNLQFTERHIEQLRNYDWPGNVRELQNVVDRAVICARLGSLRLDVPEAVQPVSLVPTGSGGASPRSSAVLPDTELKRLERDNILAALQHSNGRIYGARGAARLLGLKPTTLSARVRKLALKQALLAPDTPRAGR